MFLDDFHLYHATNSFESIDDSLQAFLEKISITNIKLKNMSNEDIKKINKIINKNRKIIETFIFESIYCEDLKTLIQMIQLNENELEKKNMFTGKTIIDMCCLYAIQSIKSDNPIAYDVLIRVNNLLKEERFSDSEKPNTLKKICDYRNACIRMHNAPNLTVKTALEKEYDEYFKTLYQMIDLLFKRVVSNHCSYYYNKSIFNFSYNRNFELIKEDNLLLHKKWKKKVEDEEKEEEENNNKNNDEQKVHKIIKTDEKNNKK